MGWSLRLRPVYAGLIHPICADRASAHLRDEKSPHGVRTYLSISAPITEANLERKRGEVSRQLSLSSS